MPSFSLVLLKLISNPIFTPADFMEVNSCLVNPFDLLDALQLEDPFGFNQHVDSDIPVLDRLWLLERGDPDPPESKLLGAPSSKELPSKYSSGVRTPSYQPANRGTSVNPVNGDALPVKNEMTRFG